MKYKETDENSSFYEEYQKSYEYTKQRNRDKYNLKKEKDKEKRKKRKGGQYDEE